MAAIVAGWLRDARAIASRTCWYSSGVNSGSVYPGDRRLSKSLDPSPLTNSSRTRSMSASVTTGACSAFM
ncbi:hypothetical protein D3C83_153740 [compost metagenome]